MSLLREEVRNHLSGLIPVFGVRSSSNLIFEIVDLLTRESLALDLERPLPKFSSINNDGVPLEFSISAGSVSGGLRILTEIGVPGSSLPRRMEMTVLRLRELLTLLNLEDAAAEIDTAIATLFPQDSRELKGWRGVIWVAAAFLPGGKTGLRLYCNTADGDLAARRNRAAALLSALGRGNSLRKLENLAPLLSSSTEPLGVAFDILPNGLGKIKVYSRTTDCSEEVLDAFLAATELSQYEEILHLFSRCVLVVRDAYPPTSVVLSVELPTDPAVAPALKIDVCAHCLYFDDSTARQACGAFGREANFQLDEYEHLLNEVSCGILSSEKLLHHAFVGIGFSHGRSPRFNIYLKPSIEVYLREQSANGHRRSGHYPDRVGAAKQMRGERNGLRDWRDAICASVEYVLHRQGPAGQWLDFELPVGISDAWVTAYVGLALASLPQEFRSKKVDAALRRAVRWCRSAMQPDFGWGFNAFTESDADSSAYSLLFLTSMNCDIPSGCLNFLLSRQREDGGFSTYKKSDPADTWGISHPDVTPVVLRALMHHLAPDSDPIDRGRDYVLHHQNEEGYWDSYWWTTSLYSTWANLSLLASTRWSFRDGQCFDYISAQPEPDDPFRLALLTGIRYLLGSLRGISEPDHLASMGRLLAMQEPDGRWAPAALLRLTNDRLKTPWTHEDAGPVFTDQKGLFSTATILVCTQPIFMKQVFSE